LAELPIAVLFTFMGKPDESIPSDGVRSDSVNDIVDEITHCHLRKVV
jgi:hypothetical protein